MLVEQADYVLSHIEQVVLGRVVSTPRQRRTTQQAAEAALLRSSYAFWEDALWHVARALLLAARRLLADGCRLLYGAKQF